MLDLVGNPKDRFCRDVAQINEEDGIVSKMILDTFFAVYPIPSFSDTSSIAVINKLAL